MTIKEIIDLCLSKKCAYLYLPFGEIPICIKVKGRIFAQIYFKENDLKLTLNCEPMTGEFYKSQYKNTVIRAYHCPAIQQPYFYTVLLNGAVSDEELWRMIELSYKTVVGKLTKKLQLEIENE